MYSQRESASVLVISIYDASSGEGDHHASVQCPSPQVSAGASYAHWPGWGWSVAMMTSHPIAQLATPLLVMGSLEKIFVTKIYL